MIALSAQVKVLVFGSCESERVLRSDPAQPERMMSNAMLNAADGEKRIVFDIIITPFTSILGLSCHY